jgi:hypothetical protein
MKIEEKTSELMCKYEHVKCEKTELRVQCLLEYKLGWKIK